MNVLHIRYALEVARAGSLNRAAETLLVAQPNLSRSIKELEGELGFKLFERSSRGMDLTPEGGAFIRDAQGALERLDKLEQMYRPGTTAKKRFSIAVPRAGYIAEAFARLTANIGEEPAEIAYLEANASRAAEAVLHGDCRLGIVRFAAGDERRFEEALARKGLAFERVASFSPALIVSRDSPLATQAEIAPDELRPYIEILCRNPNGLFLSTAESEAYGGEGRRRILLGEGVDPFELLAQNPQTYLRACSPGRRTLERFGLTVRPCAEGSETYCDALIRREGYALTALDNRFVDDLREAARRSL